MNFNRMLSLVAALALAISIPAAADIPSGAQSAEQDLILAEATADRDEVKPGPAARASAALASGDTNDGRGHAVALDQMPFSYSEVDTSSDAPLHQSGGHINSSGGHGSALEWARGLDRLRSGLVSVATAPDRPAPG